MPATEPPAHAPVAPAHAPVAPTASPNPAALDRYADIAIRIGTNLQPNQTLYIRAPIETAAFVRRIAAKAYAAGAKDVHVEWDDEQLALVRYQRAPEQALAEFPDWKARPLQELAENGAAFLSVAASDPDLLKDIDPDRIATANRARMTALSGWYKLITGMRTTWTIVSVPTPGWAAKVFPDLPAEQRTQRLWEYILKTVRIDTAEAPLLAAEVKAPGFAGPQPSAAGPQPSAAGPQPSASPTDPVQAWRHHLAELNARATHMNTAHFHRLHYTAPGTDLTIELPAVHRWVTSPITDPRGIAFVPNLPTEEIFTVPTRGGVHGTVTASMPLNYRGALIDGMRLQFEAGRVIDADARTGRDTLQRLLDTDDGARHLGEVALVPHGSAVSRLGTLFYNTLFDENAACHLAIGRAYPMCLEGGNAMSAEELARHGANTSLEHVDFMIGSDQMSIDGETADGAVVPVMRAGKWAFGV